MRPDKHKKYKLKSKFMKISLNLVSRAVLLLLTFSMLSSCAIIRPLISFQTFAIEADFREINTNVISNRTDAELAARSAKRSFREDADKLAAAKDKYDAAKDESDAFYSHLENAISGNQDYSPSDLKDYSSGVTSNTNDLIKYVEREKSGADGTAMSLGTVVTIIGVFADVAKFKEALDVPAQVRTDLLKRVSDSKWKNWDEL